MCPRRFQHEAERAQGNAGVFVGELLRAVGAVRLVLLVREPSQANGGRQVVILRDWTTHQLRHEVGVEGRSGRAPAVRWSVLVLDEELVRLHDSILPNGYGQEPGGHGAGEGLGGRPGGCDTPRITWANPRSTYSSFCISVLAFWSCDCRQMVLEKKEEG